MQTTTLGSHTYYVDVEGFMTDPSQWDEDLAHEMAKLVNIDLTEEHLKALRFMREDASKTGATPTLRRMQAEGGFNLKELFKLFPGKTLKLMSWLSGLSKPVACV